MAFGQQDAAGGDIVRAKTMSQLLRGLLSALVVSWRALASPRIDTPSNAGLYQSPKLVVQSRAEQRCEY